jgi:hypothetical protein
MHQFLKTPQYLDQTMKTKNYVWHYKVLYEYNGNKLIFLKIKFNLNSNSTHRFQTQ